MDIEHFCPRLSSGAVLRIRPGERCPFCGQETRLLHTAQETEDGEIIQRLLELDRRDDVELDAWECSFVESMLMLDGDRGHDMTPRQREAARKMLDKYGG